MEILVNILWPILGYLIGSINFAMILTIFSKSKERIDELGSKNAGSTNALRNYGIAFGFLVFFLDVSKAYWFGFIGGILQQHVAEFNGLIPQISLLFVILGHIFPVFFKFKGGKGAATNLGLISTISLPLAAIGFVIFMFIFATTKYVSLSSIVTPLLIAPLSFITPYFNGWVDSMIKVNAPIFLNFLILFIAALIIVISHHENIKRLINGTERKLRKKEIGKKETSQ